MKSFPLNLKVGVLLSILIIAIIAYYIVILHLQTTSYFNTSILALPILTFAITILIVFLFQRGIHKYSDEITTVTENLALGDLSKRPTLNIKDGESNVSKNINKMIDNLENALKFTQSVGTGKYADADYKLASDQDALGKALVNMCNKLIGLNEKEKEKQWLTEGLAKFEILLRTHTQTLEILGDRVLSGLVNYLKANQGALYLHMEEEGTKKEYLHLLSCYAYGRKKFIQREFEIGEGLIGQAFLEKEKVLLTEIPHDYIKISSGLGEALPDCVLIVPLITNNHIHGILELATFKKFNTAELEFVEKLSESIASTLENVRTSEKTEFLLKQSQLQAEELKVQEEEMRANIEELNSIQEEMKRNQLELEKNKAELIAKNKEILEITNKERERTETLLAAQKKTMEHLVTKMKQEQERLSVALLQKEKELENIFKIKNQ